MDHTTTEPATNGIVNEICAKLTEPGRLHDAAALLNRLSAE